MIEIKFDAYLNSYGKNVIEILHERQEWRDTAEWYPEEKLLTRWSKLPNRNSIPFATTQYMTRERMFSPTGSKYVKDGWSVHCLTSNSRDEIDFFLVKLLPWLINKPVEVRVWETSWKKAAYLMVNPK